MAATNPIDYFVIKNTIARYSIALDTKDFDLFSEVFTEDVEAKYPFGPSGGQIKGAKQLANAIKTRLAFVKTQHALTTQLIRIDENGQTATATTYFTGLHLGTGKWEGQQITSWGKYHDKLVMTPSKETLPGASGQWYIQERELKFMGRLGEEGVLQG